MSDSRPLRFAAFDFDGTLIDSAAAIVAGVEACWDACGFGTPDPLAVRRTIGLAWEDAIRTLIPGAGDAEFARIRAYHDAISRGEKPRPRQALSLFPGAVEMLAGLAAEDYLLGIVTSRGASRVFDLLEEHGIHHHFLSVKTADHGPAKPNPHLLLEAMAELGADAARTVMVGDTVFDVQMAMNAGTRAVGVSWGVHGRDELTDAGAAHVIDSWSDLPALLDALTGDPK